MHLFNSGLFWFAEGIFVCLAVVGFKVWAEDKGIPLPFWKWSLLGIWALFFGFTIAFITTSLGEGEPAAAINGGIIFGVISIVSGVGIFRLVLIGKKSM